MVKSRFTEPQIFGILKKVDAGMKVETVSCKHNISNSTYYNWKSECGGMDTSELKRMREPVKENAKLIKYLQMPALKAWR